MEAFWLEKRVLVTGANGFVGAWLVKTLLRERATVVALVRDDTPGGLRLHRLSGDIVTVRGDVTDALLLARVLNEYEIDTVFHLAAQSLVPIAARSPLSTFESNIRGTWTLLEQCRLVGRLRRIVVSTSDKVYGNQDSARLSEEAPLLGLYPYDVSKVCADLIARSYAASFGLPVAVARFANLFGGGDLNFSRIVPCAMRSALLGRPIILRSDGSHQRGFLYVEDAVSGFLALARGLDRDDVRGQAFNFGGGETVEIMTLAKLIAALAGRGDLPVVCGGAPATGEIRRQSLDSAKASGVLGWRPSVDLADGLRITMDWYRGFFGV
jgi:CDP-glucose 4,6-dehydratase